MSCSEILSSYNTNPLIGCDGKPHSTEYLLWAIENAEQHEQYELCIIYKNEIDKREKYHAKLRSSNSRNKTA